MRRFLELFVVALLAVGLAVAYQAGAAFLTRTSGPVYNSGYQAAYFNQLVDFDMKPATLITPGVGTLQAVTGLEVGDVLQAALNFSPFGTPVDVEANFSVSATAGYARMTTLTNLTKDDVVLFVFSNIDNDSGN